MPTPEEEYMALMTGGTDREPTITEQQNADDPQSTQETDMERQFGLKLPPNLDQARYEHLLENERAFHHDKGDEIIEYFVDHQDPYKYPGFDLYERVCADLGIEPIKDTPEDQVRRMAADILGKERADNLKIENLREITLQEMGDEELRAAGKQAYQAGDIATALEAESLLAERESNPNIGSGSPSPAEPSAIAQMVESGDLTGMETDDIFNLLDSLYTEKAVDAVRTITIELIHRAALAETPEMEADAVAELERVCGEVTPDEALEMMREVINACGEALSGNASEYDPGPAVQPGSFADVLKQIDPRDSDAALAMLDWLETYGRLNQVGTLHGGQGYLYVYKEPKGTSKAGYVPGGTKGGRLVDKAVSEARASGKGPIKRSVCRHCFSAVAEDPEAGVIYREDGVIETNPDNMETGSDVCANSPTGEHEMA